MRKGIRYAASAVAAAALTLPALVLANAGTFQTDAGGGTGLPQGTVFGIVQNIMRWLLGLVGIVGVIGFAIAGILYLTAAGDEDRIATAKKAMTYSIIGVIVGISGLVIIYAATLALSANPSF